MTLKKPFDRNFLSILGIILLGVSLVMLLAIICDYFDVYIPGVVNLIPPERRPAPSRPFDPANPSPGQEEKVIVIEKPGQPQTEGEKGKESPPSPGGKSHAGGERLSASAGQKAGVE
jgi:hypothetical protein